VALIEQLHEIWGGQPISKRKTILVPALLARRRLKDFEQSKLRRFCHRVYLRHEHIIEDTLLMGLIN